MCPKAAVSASRGKRESFKIKGKKEEVKYIYASISVVPLYADYFAEKKCSNASLRSCDVKDKRVRSAAAGLLKSL